MREVRLTDTPSLQRHLVEHGEEFLFADAREFHAQLHDIGKHLALLKLLLRKEQHRRRKIECVAKLYHGALFEVVFWCRINRPNYPW